MEVSSENDSFTRKISVLHETPKLLDNQDFDDLKNIKNCKDKLEKMTNIHYYIKSLDISKIIKSKDKNIYLRLIIDSPNKYINKEFVFPKKEINDNMSTEDSPHMSKSLSSKSTENILKKKYINHHSKYISIDSKLHLIYYKLNNEKHSVFLCKMKDDIINCTSVNDKDINGYKLLKYESVDVNIDDIKMIINSRCLKILKFPIYFILQGSELTIEDLVSKLNLIFIKVLS